MHTKLESENVNEIGSRYRFEYAIKIYLKEIGCEDVDCLRIGSNGWPFGTM
jgi:hypothetical protein